MTNQDDLRADGRAREGEEGEEDEVAGSVLDLLRDPGYQQLTNAALGRLCGVTGSHTSKMRKRLELAGEIPILDELLDEQGEAVDRSESARRRRAERVALEAREAARAREDADAPPGEGEEGEEAGDPDAPPDVSVLGRCADAGELVDFVNTLNAARGRVTDIIVVWDSLASLPYAELARVDAHLTGHGFTSARPIQALRGADVVLRWVLGPAGHGGEP
jgi:hypothetical protein